MSPSPFHWGKPWTNVYIHYIPYKIFIDFYARKLSHEAAYTHVSVPNMEAEGTKHKPRRK